MTPMHRINITMDAETLSALEEIKQHTGAGRSEILRRAVLAYAKELANAKPMKIRLPGPARDRTLHESQVKLRDRLATKTKKK